MASRLEAAPAQVKQRIALFSVSSTILGPPSALLPLLLTSHAMHDALSLYVSPELYAQIYQLKFDLSATFRRTHDSRASLTPPCLANELVKRCQLLRRIRLKDWGSDTVAADLWTAYLMIMESDGLNESQLIAARFPRFISEFTLRHLRSNCYQRRTSDIDSLAVWLYWFTLSRGE